MESVISERTGREKSAERISLALTPSMRQYLEALSDYEGRSLSATAVMLIKEAMQTRMDA